MNVLRQSRKENFTIVNNLAIDDERLSSKDLGILIRLLRLPDNWNFTESGLIKIFKKDGKTSIRTCLKNLERFGYLERMMVRENGKIRDTEWFIYDVSQEKDFTLKENKKLKENGVVKTYKANNQVEDFQYSHFETIEKRQQINTNIINTNKINSKEEERKKNSKKQNLKIKNKPGKKEEENKTEKTYREKLAGGGYTEGAIKDTLTRLTAYFNKYGQPQKANPAYILNPKFFQDNLSLADSLRREEINGRDLASDAELEMIT
jgi:hypothetical protein